MKVSYSSGFLRAFLGMAVSVISCVLYGQDSLARYSQLKEELTAHYLGDTLHPTAKIRELISSAMMSGGEHDRLAAIEKYQVAFALAPYAKDSIDVLTSLYGHFSGLLYYSGAEDMSILYAKKAYEYCNKAHPEATEWKYNILGKIAAFYLTYKQYDSSGWYFDRALKEANALKKPIWNASATNNIGMLHEAKGFHDTAYALFCIARNMLKLNTRDDSSLCASINDNIAQNFYARKQFDKAIDLYNSNLVLYKSLGGNEGIFKTELGLASSYISLHKFKEAGELILLLVNGQGIKNRLKNIDRRIKILNIYKQYDSEKGNWDKAFEDQNIIAALKDTLANDQKRTTDGLIRALTETEILKAHKDIEVYRMQLKGKENALLESGKKAELRLIISILVALIGGITIVLVTLNYRQKSKAEKRIREYKEEIAAREIERRKLEQEKLEQELHFKKVDLHDLGIYLSKVKDMHATISDRLLEIRNQKSEVQKETISSLLHELNSQIYSQQRLQLIQESIEEVNTEFYSKLSKKYPDLTKSEMELCGFFKLNMSNKEISALKGISLESVKMGRYRLRKKLNMQPEEDIYKKLAEV